MTNRKEAQTLCFRSSTARDTLDGGAGDDWMEGEEGDDKLVGGNDDILLSGNSKDHLWGDRAGSDASNQERDSLDGEAGGNTLNRRAIQLLKRVAANGIFRIAA